MGLTWLPLCQGKSHGEGMLREGLAAQRMGKMRLRNGAWFHANAQLCQLQTFELELEL